MEENYMAKNIEIRLGSEDLSQIEKRVNPMNQNRRLPSIVLVDTSGSMYNYANLLKKSVEELNDAILSDRRAAKSTELAVLTFNSDIEILERMREIKSQESKGKNLDFHCE